MVARDGELPGKLFHLVGLGPDNRGRWIALHKAEFLHFLLETSWVVVKFDLFGLFPANDSLGVLSRDRL